MAISDGTAVYPARFTFGTLNYKNIYSGTFGYTQTHKKVAAGTSTAILSSTAGASTAQTITSATSITQPDVARALSVTVGGTASGIQSGSVIITGYNTEGKVITESFPVVAGTTATLNGVKAFARVTSIFIPAQVGATATFTVGTQNILGIRHRLFRNNTTVKVYTATTVYGSLTLQGVPTVVANDKDLELNTVLPATIPDGTKMFIICYAFDNWALVPFQDQPEYSTTTSTSSTSSSTSTTTITTSTSSTSISTSSTSASTSSTSISTSSTSTSTTTTP